MNKLCVCLYENPIARIRFYNNFLRMIAWSREKKNSRSGRSACLFLCKSSLESLLSLMIRREKAMALLSPRCTLLFSFLFFSRHLIQYWPCVHQVRLQRFCPGAEHAAGHPRKFARGRAQCSACRIKRKTNVNYSRIALQRPWQSAAFDNSRCPSPF